MGIDIYYHIPGIKTCNDDSTAKFHWTPEGGFFIYRDVKIIKYNNVHVVGPVCVCVTMLNKQDKKGNLLSQY